MPQQSMNTPAALVFPYRISPAVRRYTTALLYSGRLEVGIPDWLTTAPIDSFNIVWKYASHKNDPLLSLLDVVAQYFKKLQMEALYIKKDLDPYGDRIRYVEHLYAGDRASYSWQDSISSDAISVVTNSLHNQAIYALAAAEFIWRVHELYLELQHDPAKVLAELHQRVQKHGGTAEVLAEGLLQRYFFLHRTPNAVVATNESSCLEALGLIASVCPAMSNIGELRRQDLAFAIFDRIVSPYSPLLNAEHSEDISYLLDEQHEVRHLLKKRCLDESALLISSADKIDDFNGTVSEVVGHLQEEVQAFLKISEQSFTQLCREIAGDSSFWALVGGCAASAAGGIPILSAGLALAAFPVLGAAAFRHNETIAKEISASPWGIIYYLRNRD